MRSRWNFVIVLVYMGIASAGLAVMAINMGGPCLLQNCKVYSVEFKNASGLLHSNDVRVAGVAAGQVVAITQEKNLALVQVKVEQPFQPLYKDAHAVVRPKNLLGETYVEIDRGTEAAGELEAGGTIPLAQTLTPVQVDEVLNAFDPSTRQRLQLILNALGEATALRGKDMNLGAEAFKRITTDLATTSTSLNAEQDNIDALLVQLDKIQQTSADYHQQLAEVLAKWDFTSRTLANHDVALASGLSNLNGVLADLDTGLTPNAVALHSAVSQLPATIDDTKNFLGISNSLTGLFVKPLKPGEKPVIQDGINLFSRLAQVMTGANGCDTQIYATGYQNKPGTTENAACPAPGTPLTDKFGGSEQAKGDSSTGGNRHLWRVMGMFQGSEVQCGLQSPGAQPPSSPACSPGTNGTEDFTAPSTPQAASSSAPPSSQGRVGFFQQLWQDLVGGGNA